MKSAIHWAGWLVLLWTLLVEPVAAVDVAVIVQYPTGVVDTDCVEVDDETNGYDLLRASTFDTVWLETELFGHALCAIEGEGCPADDCFCSQSSWRRYVASNGARDWSDMSASFDAGQTCWNGDARSFVGHYCTSDGDIVGLRFGITGMKPQLMSFDEICAKEEKPQPKVHRKERPEVDVRIEPDQPLEDRAFKITLTDSESEKPIRGAEIKIYRGMPLASPRVYEGETDKKGQVIVPGLDAGRYQLKIAGVSGYSNTDLQTIVVEEAARSPRTIELAAEKEAPPPAAPTTSLSATTTTFSSTTTTTMPPVERAPEPRPLAEEDSGGIRRLSFGSTTGAAVKLKPYSPPSPQTWLWITLGLLIASALHMRVEH